MKFILSLSLLALILGSCGSSNEVVGGGIFQKRKYNNGFYWNRNSGLKDSEAKNAEDVDIREGDDEKVSKNNSGSTTNYSEDNDVKAGNTNSELTSDQAAVDNPLENKIENTDRSNEERSDAIPETTGAKEVNFTQGTKVSDKRDSKKKRTVSPAADVSTILLVILAIILPPLAVYLFEGVTKRFWIDLILALIGWGVGFWLLGGLGWICGIIAIVYALMIVLNAI